MEEWDTHREEMDPSHGESLDNEEGVEEKKKKKKREKGEQINGSATIKSNNNEIITMEKSIL
mgnify:CR=1 FL=1